MWKNKKVIITMTSWTGRINYVKDTLASCLNQTILPDKIYLNLSIKEFEGINLPKELFDFINNNSNKVILNWVDGPNTKPFKKIFPILKYLDDEDFIINVDDDMIFPRKFIESRLNDFEKYNTCISGSIEKVNGYAKGLLPEFKTRVGPSSLYQKKMFNHWEEILNNEIIRTNHDDAFYDFLIYLNGYLPQSCSEYSCGKCFIYPHTPALHGSIGCANAVQATVINIEVFKTIYNCFPCFNYYKTNEKENIGKPINEINSSVENILRNTERFISKENH